METAKSLRKKLDDDRAARSELKAVLAAHHGVSERGEAPTGEPADKFQAELSEKVRAEREKNSFAESRKADDKVKPNAEVGPSPTPAAGSENTTVIKK